MNLKEHLTYKTGKQIWRILISGSEKVLIEKRDMESKEVYFDCLDLVSGEYVFTDLQFEEKFWIGIEKIYKDVIFFHKYSKPDMPGHQEIIAVDMNTQEILWRNQEYIYGFVHQGKVFVFKQQFEGRKYLTLDYRTGEVFEESGINLDEINKLYDESRNAEDYSDYRFPEKGFGADGKIMNIIEKLKDNTSADGMEYFLVDDMLFCSYHIKTENNKMDQEFSIVSETTGEKIFSETLCNGTERIMTDSFFIYKQFLFLLMEKNGLKIYIINKKED